MTLFSIRTFGREMNPVLLVVIATLLFSSYTIADNNTDIKTQSIDHVNCLMDELLEAGDDVGVSDIRGRCPSESDTDKLFSEQVEGSVISRRWKYEQQPTKRQQRRNRARLNLPNKS